MEKERISKISDSEWQIMEHVWAHSKRNETAEVSMENGQVTVNAGITQPCLMELLGNKWNKNTVHTFLKRLCDKGYLMVVKETSPHQYVPLVTREECEKEERRSFLDRVYQGSAGRMVTAFVRDGGLKEEEVAELRKLLDELEV